MNSEETHLNLILRYQSGLATGEEVAELEQLMLKDEQLREDFLFHARVDAALTGAIYDEPDLIEVPVAKAQPITIKWTRRALVAAAAFAIGLTIWGVFRSENPEYPLEVVAHFGKLHECRWIDPQKTFESNAPIAVGQRIELSSGKAEVEFLNGAAMEIVGPAIFELRSEKNGFLTMGEIHLVAETPESTGFTIETPTSQFIDISTAFTAAVSPDGLSRVDVTDGEVDVVVEGNKLERFKRGESLLIEPGLRKILARIEPGDATAEFRFPTIPPPSADDFADQSKGRASIRVARGQLRTARSSSGPVSVLLDGKGQLKQDAPRQSAFFETGSEGRFLIDLGTTVAIDRINSYSWHQHNEIAEHRERARQEYTLYGFPGDQLPDLSEPLEQTDWTRIARVNSDEFFRVNQRLDRPAQQASSISAATGPIGEFRYLLWDLKGNSFYGEIDVFGTPRNDGVPSAAKPIRRQDPAAP